MTTTNNRKQWYTKHLFSISCELCFICWCSFHNYHLFFFLSFSHSFNKININIISFFQQINTTQVLTIYLGTTTLHIKHIYINVKWYVSFMFMFFVFLYNNKKWHLFVFRLKFFSKVPLSVFYFILKTEYKF